MVKIVNQEVYTCLLLTRANILLFNSDQTASFQQSNFSDQAAPSPQKKLYIMKAANNAIVNDLYSQIQSLEGPSVPASASYQSIG